MIVRPNICLVVPDDAWARDAYRFAGAPSPARLSFLEMMVEDGILLERYYTQPACSTTRASILTGLFPGRTGLGEVVDDDDQFVLSYSHRSIFVEAAAAGYWTSLCGKHHITSRLAPGWRTDATDRGAGRWRGSVGNLLAPDDYYNWMGLEDGVEVWQSVYSTSQIFEWAAEDISAAPEPWFVVVSPHAAHEPFHVPPTGSYATPPVDPAGQWRAALEATDKAIALLWSSMDAGVRERTLWLVASDNGSPVDVTSAPHGQRKGSVGEGGIRNQLVAWHSDLPGGVRLPNLVTCSDLYATIQDACGAGGPRPQDSVSFWGALQGSGDPGRPWVYAQKHRPNGGPPYTVRQRAALDGRWKVQLRQKEGQAEVETMYDLAVDPWNDGPELDLDNLNSEQQNARQFLLGVIAASS